MIQLSNHQLVMLEVEYNAHYVVICNIINNNMSAYQTHDLPCPVRYCPPVKQEIITYESC